MNHEEKKNDAALPASTGTDSPAFMELLLSDNAKRLKAILDADDRAALKSLYGAGSKSLEALLLDEDSKRLKRFLFGDNFKNLAEIARYSRVRAQVQFEEAWSALERVVDIGAPGIEARLNEQRHLLLNTEKIWDHLTQAVMDDGVAKLRHGSLRFPDRAALWTLLQEILINEDYFAELGTDSPRILDCGAHYGAGVYYFVTRYPGARVTAFEPDPSNLGVLSENVSKNGFANVEVLPYALSAEDGARTLYRSEQFTMASALSDRRKHFGESLKPVEVQCRRLSPYLNEPIDFLKLDIEGEEDRVLAECAGALPNVHYLFCEYHQGAGLSGDRLPKILQLLEDSGFNVQVGKSYSTQQRTGRRPMTFVDGPYSAVIYAKNRNWPPKA